MNDKQRQIAQFSIDTKKFTPVLATLYIEVVFIESNMTKRKYYRLLRRGGDSNMSDIDNALDDILDEVNADLTVKESKSTAKHEYNDKENIQETLTDEDTITLNKLTKLHNTFAKASLTLRAFYKSKQFESVRDKLCADKETNDYIYRQTYRVSIETLRSYKTSQFILEQMTDNEVFDIVSLVK